MIIELLQLDDWIGISEEVEIAKGKYKLPTTFKEGVKKIRREWLRK